MHYEFSQNSLQYSVKKAFESVSQNEAVIRFQDRKEIESFFGNAMRSSTNCRAFKSISKDFTPSYCCRSRKNKPEPTESERLQALYDEIYKGNAIIVLKNDHLNSQSAQYLKAKEERQEYDETSDFISALYRQAKRMKEVLSKLVHSDYSLLETVYSYAENSTGPIPVTLDLASVQEHSTGWKKWDDPFEIAALGAFKSVAAYSAASFLGLSNSIKAAMVIGSQTELISAEYFVTGKSIEMQKWYGSYAIRYNVRTLSLEIPWIKYRGSGPAERLLVELKRKDRLKFINNKLYNHPEQIIPPFHSMNDYIANYQKGLVLPKHDLSKPLIMNK